MNGIVQQREQVLIHSNTLNDQSAPYTQAICLKQRWAGSPAAALMSGQERPAVSSLTGLGRGQSPLAPAMWRAASCT